MENQNSDQNPDQSMMSDTTQSEDQNQSINLSSSPTLTTTTIRSYECTFCKRGFTNAQALGGHMNIHRKDKAKLKQLAFSVHHETTSDNSKIDSLYSSPNLPTMMNNSPLEGSDQHTKIAPSDDRGIMISKWPNFFLDQDTSNHIYHDHDHGDKDQKPDNHGSPDSELDLELRLGPEPPQDTSSTSVATRKFF